MKCKQLSLLVSGALLTSFLFSCGGKSNKRGGKDGASEKTGWKINNDQGGWFFTDTDYKNQPTAPGLVFVEGGTFAMGRVKDDVMHDWNNSPSRQQVRSFYIDETEVENIFYREYLDWIKQTFPPTQAEFKQVYIGALPDTLVWRDELSANETYIENYFRHPAFNYYPVVGVSWLQAQRFCEWRTDRVNEKQLVDAGIIKDFYQGQTQDSLSQGDVKGANHFSTKLYKMDAAKVMGEDNDIFQGANQKKNSKNGTANFSKFDGSVLPAYRLPTEAEWEYAALALPANREYNSYQGKKIEEKEIRAKKGKSRGDLLANYKRGRGDYSGVGGWGNDKASITAETKAYPPNDFGLYGMNGNIAEWVADVYRPKIDEQNSDFNYYRGNVYKKVIKEDGRVVTVGSSEIQYDTLNDGRLLYKTLPGQAKEEVVGDVRNYKDGDSESLINPFANSTDEMTMYDAPKREFIVDSKTGAIRLVKDRSIERKTDVNDETRVVKGGSWKDRIYWLDPAQRRYMHQAEATNWIGFRCAMDRVGSDQKSNKRASFGKGRK